MANDSTVGRMRTFLTKPSPAIPRACGTRETKPVANTPQNRRLAHIGYTGSVMPPPEAVAGTYVGPDGKKITVPALSDEDKLTLVRWIDLGCPIDFEYDPAQPTALGRGWMLDDQRPTVALTYPRAGANEPLTRLLVGMHDTESGLDLESFQVVANFPIDGVAPGQNLARKFKPKSQNVWEYSLATPLTGFGEGRSSDGLGQRPPGAT